MKPGIKSLLLGGALLAGGLAAQTTSIRIEQTVEGQFPAALAFLPITEGDVQVAINVDADGHLVDLLVTGYTHPAFVDEAVRLLKAWKYAPATVDGHPVGARAELQVHFVSRGRVVSLSIPDAVAAYTGVYRRMPIQSRVCQARDLDRPVAAVRTVNPPVLTSSSPATGGTTLLDFYVDESGRPRMPVVVSTTEEAYAQAAVWALEQWRFAAPTSHGKPVAVRVRQEFHFPAGSAPAVGNS